MPKHPKGIRRWKGGWQAYIRTREGLTSKSFPLDTALDEMKRWRLSQRLDAPKKSGTGPTLQKEIDRYLLRVTSMPTYGQRKQHLELWVQAFGADRARASITAGEIDQVLQGWLSAGLSPDTVRKRRTSLLSLFSKLDGKAATNPVRETTPPKPTRAKMRGLETATLQHVLESLPGRNTKKGVVPSKTAARLRVMAWTGLPPGMLMKVTAADVHLKRAELRVPAREKGAGSPARVLALTPQAVAAFEEMIALDAFGDFAIAAAGRVLHRACKRCGVDRIRLYDLRHSFGALLYRMTKDLPTVARFLLHQNLTSTARYAMSAVGDVDRAAALAVGQLPGTTFSPKRRTKPHRSALRPQAPRTRRRRKQLTKSLNV